VGLKELVTALDASWGCDLVRTTPWLLEPMMISIVEEFKAVVVYEVDLNEVVRGWRWYRLDWKFSGP
jgi:hypothetical protein